MKLFAKYCEYLANHGMFFLHDAFPNAVLCEHREHKQGKKSFVFLHVR